MLNITELEKKWLKYKIKSYLPHAIIALGTLTILVLIFMVLNYDSNKVTPEIKEVKTEQIEKIAPVVVESNVSKEIVKVAPVVAEQPTEIEKPVKKDEKLIITPSLQFIENIEKEKVKATTTKRSSPPRKEQIIEEVIQKPSVVHESTQKPIVVEEETTTINIKREDTKNDIQEVIQRFNKNNSPALSLFVAKKYYELGNYSMAYNYALKTNEIDNSIEASWILFAKSLVKLGKKEQAIKTLQEYVNHSHSSRAKTLLDEIISGKMK